MGNEFHPCWSFAASFEITVFDFEIRKRDRNNECCLSSFCCVKRAEGKEIVRGNPDPLKGIREADCTELLPTSGNPTRYSEGVKGKFRKFIFLFCLSVGAVAIGT